MTSGPGMGAYRPPGGAGSITYDPQHTRHWPVGGVGDSFHTVRGGINAGNIRVRSRVDGDYVCVDGL